MVLHRSSPGGSGWSPADPVIAVLVAPAMTAESGDVGACIAPADAAGNGRSVADLVAAIRSRPGVVVLASIGVSIGSFPGRQLDLELAPSWTAGCTAPDGTRAVGRTLLHNDGASGGAVVGLAPDQPIRLILVDMGSDRTIAIVVFRTGGSPPTPLADLVGPAMPVVGSFEFQRTGS